jgi:hypothetical protein
VDILVSMAPDVYGPYVSVTKTGQKVLIVECLNAVYGTMVAALLYYKKFVKSLKSKAFKLNPYDGCVAKAVIFLARRRIRRYANDRCEVFFCSRLFVCVFVSGNFVFVG